MARREKIEPRCFGRKRPQRSGRYSTDIAPARTPQPARPSPHAPAFATHIFLTRTGKLWVDRDATNRDSIGEQFRELTKAVGCYQKLVGFYSLRHTFATIASGCGDQIAVDHVMGHIDSGMSAHYREFIYRGRIPLACNHVRTWLLNERPEPDNVS